MSIAKFDLNITVAGYLSTGGSGDEIISSLKTAILFGDNVTLHSIQIQNYLFYFKLMDIGITRREVAKYFRLFFGKDADSEVFLDKSMDLDEFVKFDDLIGETNFDLEKNKNLLREYSSKAISSDNLRQIFSAIKSKSIVMSDFEYDFKDESTKINPIIAGDIAYIIKTFNDPNLIPLLDSDFDRMTRDISEIGLLKHQFVESAKQMRLSEKLLSGLQVIRKLDIEEIIELKNDEKSSLIRFRQAVSEFASEISSHPWEKSFEFDVKQLYIRKIEPCLLDIEESINENSLVKKTWKTLSTHPLVTGTALSIGLSNLFGMSSLIPSAAVGLTVAAVSILHEYFESQKAIEKNKLFFLYKIKEQS